MASNLRRIKSSNFVCKWVQIRAFPCSILLEPPESIAKNNFPSVSLYVWWAINKMLNCDDGRFESKAGLRIVGCCVIRQHFSNVTCLYNKLKFCHLVQSCTFSLSLTDDEQLRMLHGASLSALSFVPLCKTTEIQQILARKKCHINLKLKTSRHLCKFTL